MADAEPAAGAAVTVADLTWRPLGRARPVLAGVGFVLAPGERVVLAGPSGSGKSTLLRVLAGVLDPEDGELAGHVEVGGRAGLLLQDPRDAQVAERAGRDTAFGLENARVPAATMPAAVAAAHAAVRFPYGPSRRVQALSGGEAQRLALAGVLVFEPGLVLLDEPTAMLDPASAAAVRDAVLAAADASRATVVVVEHRFEPWSPFAQRVLLLDASGRLAFDGAGDALPEADGVWQPGRPAPRPLQLAPALLAPAAVASPGTVVLRAERVAAVPASTGRGAAVVQDLDVQVRAGSILAVQGPSGAGKSTLAAVLAGLAPPASGAVALQPPLAEPAVAPSALSSTRLAGLVGWVPQEPELAVVARTVRDEVLATPRALGMGREERADELLAVLGLDEPDEDPHVLSGGEQRRLALAAALAHGPAVLVLDEPTVGQDPGTWAAVAGVLLAARDAGVAVVVATHDPLLAALADDRLALPGRAPEPEQLAPRVRALGRRAGPLGLLLSGALLLAGSAPITSPLPGALGLLAVAACAPFVVGGGVPARRLLPPLVAALSLGIATLLFGTVHDVSAALTAALRIAFFAVPGVALAALIDPSALGDALGQRLRLPARPVVAATAAWLRFGQLADGWRTLRGVRRIRGLARPGPIGRVRELAALTAAILVATLRQAARMAVAMEARGFGTATRRTWAADSPWRAADTAVVLLAAVVAAVPVLTVLLAGTGVG
ncbi:ATP-binding cassette domain-containing protein [Amnibacterium sp. CER49]|uniref:ATP-binding cassette domain-containing protein n=1 Tax=Amnibacterium sp. CER49 TaxID=3039161 RepID=UPI00244CA424|nr:ATP-binding cassette domain-containing protein [Amnibacterium sp. CER49]MDH2444297.1 ATP-binding cassette domain-containing protein [Amnibacterium sp. CER49]